MCGANNPSCLSNDIGEPPSAVQPCQGCLTDSLGIDYLPTGTLESSVSTTGGVHSTPQVAPRSYVSRGRSNEKEPTEFLKKRALTTPEHYNFDINSFLFTELSTGTKLIPHGSMQKGDDIVGVPSAMSQMLGKKRLKLGVVNLYGCTSIIVVSKMGAWVSHFWETPTFWDSNYQFNQADFDKDITGTLSGGCIFSPTPGGSNSSVEGIGCHISPDNPGAWFNDEYNPQAIIVTPRLKVLNAGVGSLNFPNQVGQISKKLSQMLPRAPAPLIVGKISSYLV